MGSRKKTTSSASVGPSIAHGCHGARGLMRASAPPRAPRPAARGRRAGEHGVLEARLDDVALDAEELRRPRPRRRRRRAGRRRRGRSGGGAYQPRSTSRSTAGRVTGMYPVRVDHAIVCSASHIQRTNSHAACFSSSGADAQERRTSCRPWARSRARRAAGARRRRGSARCPRGSARTPCCSTSSRRGPAGSSRWTTATPGSRAPAAAA